MKLNSKGVEIEAWFAVAIIFMQSLAILLGAPTVRAIVVMVLGDVLFILLITVHILLIVNDEE